MDPRIFIGWLCKEDNERCSKPKCYAPLFVIRKGRQLHADEIETLVEFIKKYGSPDTVEYRD